MRLSQRILGVLRLCCVAMTAALPAWADGAFPDEFSIHFPVSAPRRIIVGANFGMMISEDLGSTWRYVCEPYVTEDSSDPLALVNVVYYQVGAADGEVFEVATNFKLRRSEDDGCSWTTSAGTIAALHAVDMFPQPTDSQFVVAAAVDPTGSGSSLLPSYDGALTFTAPLFTATNLITGVEVSPSSVSGTGTIYATVIGPGVATLLRSDDLGATWPNSYNLPNLPNGIAQLARILSIDPEDASTVYLRLIGPPYDSVVVATGGGQVFQVALTINDSSLTAFARGTDRTLYAGTRDGSLYVRPPPSTLVPAPQFGARINGPHLRCLGERPGTGDLYACGDMFLDGFSVGLSHDRGMSFQKVMSLSELQGTLTCPAVQTACAAHWARIQTVFARDGGIGTPDAGTGSSDGGTAPPKGGGGCSSASPNSGASLAALTLVGLWLFRKRGCRASFSNPSSPAGRERQSGHR
jgi:uncharacterized protein (TIGR03382 family)